MAAPGQPQDIQAFFKAGEALLIRLVEQPEIVGVVAQPDAQYDPAFGHQVNHGHVFSQVHGVVIRRLQHKGAQINSLGAGGIAGQHDQGRREHGLGCGDAARAERRRQIRPRSASMPSFSNWSQNCAVASGEGLGLIIRTTVGVGHITDFHGLLLSLVRLRQPKYVLAHVIQHHLL